MSEHSVTKPEKLPKGEHWAILIFDTYYSDDGWSEAEGGGSQPHPYVRYYAYDTEEEWRTELDRLFRQEPGRKDVRALPRVKPVSLSVGLSIG